MTVPFGRGNQAVQLKFSMLPDLPAVRLPTIAKSACGLLEVGAQTPEPKKAESGADSKAAATNTDSAQSSPVDKVSQVLEGAT